MRVELDLKTSAGRASALAYVARADVVIQNAPPGRMEAWGLGAAALCAAHPRLVYLHLPGFASGDAELAELGPAHEAVILGAAGVSRVPVGRAATTSPHHYPPRSVSALSRPAPRPPSFPAGVACAEARVTFRSLPSSARGTGRNETTRAAGLHQHGPLADTAGHQQPQGFFTF